MEDIVQGKSILVTGGTGSLGLALAAHLKSAARVRIFSRDEKKQLDMKGLYPDFEYILGDVRDLPTVRNAVRDMDLVIHAASLKYVDISELQPNAYVSTNVIGTQNILAAVLEERMVSHCVGISTDKACQPFNTYGLTKSILEKLFLEAHANRGEKIRTVFNVARYGNVVGTRGSVVPRWAAMRLKNEPLPLTDPEMTRFFFTLEEAVDLIRFAFMSESGVIVSKKMSACTLGMLAEVMATNGVVVSGRRPGEKTHEMLLSPEEMSRSFEVGDKFVFEPFGLVKQHYARSYTSDRAPQLTEEDLHGLLNEYLDVSRYIENKL